MGHMLQSTSVMYAVRPVVTLLMQRDRLHSMRINRWTSRGRYLNGVHLIAKMECLNGLLLEVEMEMEVETRSTPTRRRASATAGVQTPTGHTTANRVSRD
jgi:hypothetical protein